MRLAKKEDDCIKKRKETMEREVEGDERGDGKILTGNVSSCKMYKNGYILRSCLIRERNFLRQINGSVTARCLIPVMRCYSSCAHEIPPPLYTNCINIEIVQRYVS